LALVELGGIGLVQLVPQLPQLFESLVVLTSQPLFALPSQLENPGVQTGAQAPLEHEVEPFALVQAMLQPPQLAMLVSVFVSQPLTGLLSQLALPGLQVGVQTPALQAVVPLEFVHFTPQVPQ
jgi:hypothetical protein